MAQGVDRHRERVVVVLEPDRDHVRADVAIGVSVDDLSRPAVVSVFDQVAPLELGAGRHGSTALACTTMDAQTIKIAMLSTNAITPSITRRAIEPSLHYIEWHLMYQRIQCNTRILITMYKQRVTLSDMAKRDALLTMRIESEVKEAAEKAAEDDRRSLSAFVEKLLVEHLRRVGYLKAPKR
jgi:hypothetical protein